MDMNQLLYPTSEPVAAGPELRRSGRKRKSVDAFEQLKSAQPIKRRKDSAIGDTFQPKAKTGSKKSNKNQRSTVDFTTQDDNDYAKADAKTRNDSQLKPKDTEKVANDQVTTAPAANKAKKTKAQEPGEKRLKNFRKKAPQKYDALMHRATTQRMVVIDRRRPNNNHCPHSNPNCPSEEVDLAGSTGNIYTVKITHVPECTCPNFTIQHNPQCKHILNVLVKVLKAPDPLYYQQAFLTSELEEIFHHAGPLPSETVSTEDKDGKRKPIEGDCPICCEELSAESEAIVWCQAACGNNLHKSCFDQWAATKGYGRVTCPYCRTAWQNDVADASALKDVSKTGAKNKDGYVNVAEQLGMSGRRDYSSYHSYWVNRQRRAGMIDEEEYY